MGDREWNNRLNYEDTAYYNNLRNGLPFVKFWRDYRRRRAWPKYSRYLSRGLVTIVYSFKRLFLPVTKSRHEQVNSVNRS